ncbi:butyrophilin-like protein 2 [Entelurus aequoreus]|uniref:butyrophilin-like protein 2 n=1 Tax=Entelurus aequoreus TaxID=161455 RepID=UPI002B1D64A5|nr:butyrophilin-like protein 2 [Entelurus aequoreus]
MLTLVCFCPAPFSGPVLQWEEPEDSGESNFLCHATGGFPEPALYWLVDGDAPEGSVRTEMEALPDSGLYNVTSYLTINVSDANVSCVIQNPPMNQTLTATTHTRVSAGDQCVLGIVGRPLSLPCFYPDAANSTHASVEWRRDGQVVLGSSWAGGKVDNVTTSDDQEKVDKDRVTMSADAHISGKFSLTVSEVDTQEDQASYSLWFSSQGTPSTKVPVCTLCVRVTAPFSGPVLQWEEPEDSGESNFLCHATGGFPEPALYWLVDGDAPEGSVRTEMEALPDSGLYNVTSYLTINVSDANVSCVIQNPPMNQTLTATTHGVRRSPVVRRATDAMWMFSTALCVVVGVMVAVGVGYQIHLDRQSKKKKMEYLRRSRRDYCRRRHETEETEVISVQSEETNV